MRPWLQVVGIGEDGLAGLGQRAQDALAGAELIVGGRRHLSLVEDLDRPTAARLLWRSPLGDTLAELMQHRGRPCVVLASGDPLWYGVGRLLAERVDRDEIRFLPHVSAFALAAARLGWPIERTVCTSVHARPVDALRRHLTPGRRLLVLAEDEGSPAAVAGLLVALGLGGSWLQVMEHLDGPAERIVPATAETLGEGPFAALNLVAVEVVAGAAARPLPLVPGLPDDSFRHDGQITKAEIRAATLARLAPLPGQTLWDIGAGAGSIAIEWLRAAPGARALAVERDPARCRNILDNARSLGVPELELVEGEAPGCLGPLPAPDAAFVGGGGRDARLLEACLERLRPGGRLVVNVVTLDAERTLLDLHARAGGDLVRLQVSRALPIGGVTGWRPGMPVTQLTLVKPCAPGG